MKIAVASIGNPRSITTWSGTPAHIIPGIERRNHEVIAIGLDKPKEPWYYNWLRRLYKLANKGWFLSSVEKRFLISVGKQLDKKVAEIKPDVVVAIHGEIVSHVSFKQPCIFIDDLTFASVLGYYNYASDYSERSKKAGNDMYQRALNRAEAAIFAATWSAQSAINDYHAPTDKVHVIPLGPNLTETPSAMEVNDWIFKRVGDDVCTFLFLGIDWDRKGGPDALEIVSQLNKLNVKSRLVIVGATPEIPDALAPYVTVVGFLNKSNRDEAARLKRFLQDANVLILPSKAECYGCVYCEANAYGLPAIGRNTGGIPEIIKENVNGLMLGRDESPEHFAKRWADIWQNKEIYQALARSSRKEFETRLNYDKFAEKLEQIIKSIL